MHPAILLLLVCPSLGPRWHKIFINHEAVSEVLEGIDQPVLVADGASTDKELLCTWPCLVDATQPERSNDGMDEGMNMWAQLARPDLTSATCSLHICAGKADRTSQGRKPCLPCLISHLPQAAAYL